MGYAILYAAEAIAAQRRAPKPARDHNDMINQFGALKHAQDHHARAGFPIIMLYRPILAQHCGPTVMAGFGVFFIFFSALIIKRASCLVLTGAPDTEYFDPRSVRMALKICILKPYPGTAVMATEEGARGRILWLSMLNFWGLMRFYRAKRLPVDDPGFQQMAFHGGLGFQHGN